MISMANIINVSRETSNAAETSQPGDVRHLIPEHEYRKIHEYSAGMTDQQCIPRVARRKRTSWSSICTRELTSLRATQLKVRWLCGKQARYKRVPHMHV